MVYLDILRVVAGAGSPAFAGYKLQLAGKRSRAMTTGMEVS